MYLDLKKNEKKMYYEIFQTWWKKKLVCKLQ